MENNARAPLDLAPMVGRQLWMFYSGFSELFIYLVCVHEHTLCCLLKCLSKKCKL